MRQPSCICQHEQVSDHAAIVGVSGNTAAVAAAEAASADSDEDDDDSEEDVNEEEAVAAALDVSHMTLLLCLVED